MNSYQLQRPDGSASGVGSCGACHRPHAQTIRRRRPADGRYNRRVLDALQVPVSSQSVLFSKTSLQQHYISPSNPRASYFSGLRAYGNANA